MNIQLTDAEYTLAQLVMKEKGMEPAELNPVEQRIVSNFLNDLVAALEHERGFSI